MGLQGRPLLLIYPCPEQAFQVLLIHPNAINSLHSGLPAAWCAQVAQCLYPVCVTVLACKLGNWAQVGCMGLLHCVSVAVLIFSFGSQVCQCTQ